MDLPTGIGSSLLALTSGVVGYAFREWRNRAEPFVSITQIGGELRRLDKEVALEPASVQRVAKSALLRHLRPVATLSEVQDVVEVAKAMVERAPAIVERLTNVISAIESTRADSELCHHLAELFLPEYMDSYLAELLANERVRPPRPTEGAESKLEIHDSESYDGCFLVSFPNQLVTIGIAFSKEPIYRAKFQPLVKLVETLDRPGLLSIAQALRSSFESELEICRDVTPALDRLLQADSVWEIVIYFANLRSTPVLVETNANLLVTDRIGAKFSEACSMAIRIEDPSTGSVERRQTDSPIIIPAGDARSFSFFTTHTQREMARGDAFREAFAAGEANAALQLTIRSVGLLKRRNLTIKERFVGVR